jgi:predicted acetyltransferase
VSEGGRFFRTATERDVNTLASIALRAYPVPDRPVDSIREHFLDSPWSTLDDVYVGEVGGEIAASAFLHPFRVYAWGHQLGAGGLGAVAVAPDKRRSGWARDLVRHCQLVCMERGWPLMPLYPFRADFYARLGWGVAETREVFTFPVAEIPDDPAADDVHSAMLGEAETLIPVYERFALARNGHVARTAAGWMKILLRRVPFLVVHEGAEGVDGYMLYKVEPAGKHFLHQRMRIQELVWTTDAAWRGLLGYVRRQADQIAEVAYESREDDGIMHHAGHPSLPDGPILGGAFHQVSNRGLGVMMKIVDPLATLAVRTFGAGEGALHVELHDPLLESTSTFDLEVSGGRGRAGHVEARARDRLLIGTGAWAAIECGALTLAHAVRMGKAQMSGDSARWDAILRAPRWQIFEGF